MELTAFFKSVLEQDTAPVVLCDLEDTIIYLNPAAAHAYQSYGGAALLGRSLLDCHPAEACAQIHKVVEWFAASADHNIIYTYKNTQENKDVYMVALRDDEKNLIGYYEKHEYRTTESRALYDFTD